MYLEAASSKHRAETSDSKAVVSPVRSKKNDPVEGCQTVFEPHITLSDMLIFYSHLHVDTKAFILVGSSIIIYETGNFFVENLP